MSARDRNMTLNETARRGSALVTVLVIVVMLALASYSFTEFMLVELQATDHYERDVQTRALADSGAEYVAAVLGTRSQQTIPINLYHNPTMFGEILLMDASHARRRGRFSIVAASNDVALNAVRYGLIDESSKLNLNELLQFDLDEEQQRAMLMALPQMTVETADAILDWLDADEEPRQFGAENEYYGTLSPPYAAKNGPIESIEELLRVRGVTYALLYGEDWNRNGLLDPAENDADQLPPYDNADGVLQLGWSAYLTVDSREANVRRDGQPRINVNQDDLAALYDALLAEFDDETALFITAYRLSGPGNDSGGTGRGGGATGRGGGGGGGDRTGGREGGGDADGGGRGGGGAGGLGGEGGGGNAIGTGSGSTGGANETRGGLDLSAGGQYKVESLYELIGTTIRARVRGTQQTLESPWENNPSDLAASLPQILDVLTTNDKAYIAGRINISEAPREVLMAIPEIDEELVIAILGAQTAALGDSTETDPLMLTSGWLLTQGLVELEEMQTLDPYMTGSGDVYRAQIVGYFDEGPSMTRLEALIDATQSPPRILSIRDLTNLGAGYTRDHFP